MSYTSEHRRLAPVLEKARELDIAHNPAPEALFDPGIAGFNLWCTPEDQPEGWAGVPMSAGMWTKPCAFVASVGWGWEGEADDHPTITHLTLETAAYELGDHAPERYRRSPHQRDDDPRPSIFNRPADIAWAKAKTRALFAQAGVPCPPFRVRGGAA